MAGFSESLVEFGLSDGGHDPQRLRAWLLDAPAAQRRDTRALIPAIVAAYSAGVDVTPPGEWGAVRVQMVGTHGVSPEDADVALGVWAQARSVDVSQGAVSAAAGSADGGVSGVLRGAHLVMFAAAVVVVAAAFMDWYNWNFDRGRGSSGMEDAGMVTAALGAVVGVVALVTLPSGRSWTPVFAVGVFGSVAVIVANHLWFWEALIGAQLTVVAAGVGVVAAVVQLVVLQRDRATGVVAVPHGSAGVRSLPPPPS